MLVRGRRAPVVGSVCMDMSMIDVTGMDVAPGDEVVIVGAQAPEAVGVREIAASIGTIPYELLCRVGARIQRIYEWSWLNSFSEPEAVLNRAANAGTLRAKLNAERGEAAA